MAHRIRVLWIEGTNKDGTVSKRNGVFRVLDKTRGKIVVLGEYDTREEATQKMREYRAVLFDQHITTHPNDTHFVQKHEGEKDAG